MHDLIQSICAQQSPGGTFLSKVHLPFGEVDDLNCFVTAMVLRELSQLRRYSSWEDPPELQEACRRALGFLMRSKYPLYQHLYSFYPHRRHPFWMGGVLYADADDTSIIALELVRYGKRPPEILNYIAEKYLLKYRATGTLGRQLNAHWHREGVFLTWFTTADIPNPIDCCVNTNVMALLAAGHLKDTAGYAQAGAMVNAAVAWAGNDRGRLRQLTPYYPHPIELYYALDHAVTTGADELTPACDVLTHIPWLMDALNSREPLPICSSVDGDTFWVAHVVHQVRQLKRLAIRGDMQSCQE